MKKTIYLQARPLAEAVEMWRERLSAAGLPGTLSPETVKVIDALGRVTAEAVSAKISSPFFHSAAMDGYGVRFPETFGASERTPVRLRLNTDAFYVDTGDPLPDECNAVIMIEDVNLVTGKDGEESFIEITEAATPWQHVRTVGEDIVETELIIPENHTVRPVDIGALLAGGHVDIRVRRRPRVLVIPTGDELIEPGGDLKRGAIIEFNSRILSALVSEWGGEALRYSIVPDNVGELKETIERACGEGDIIVINAGSSAGSEDFTSAAIGALGEVIVHGVGIKPGKPVILGIVNGKPVLGIPGYPVSAYITCDLFLKPLVYAMHGLKPKEPETISALLSRSLASTLGQEEFVRVKVGVVGDTVIATPISRGAGVIMSLVRADGIVRIPAMSEGIGARTEVNVALLRSRDEIRNTIVCIGSHDNTLDVLANIIKKRHPLLSLASAHVGSMGGLIALKKGEAHIAGTHLLDDESGSYNIPFLQRLLPEKRVVLVNLVYREQGFVVRKGNPKHIRGFEDLLRDDIVFINRQGGSGTRLLTDKHLREMSMTPAMIKGYEREEYTHMGVASAVLTGIADTGLAIQSAARALNLDFIPVTQERYDLAIPSEFIESEMIGALLAIVRGDAEFRETVLHLGGYDITDMGKVMYEG